jgi:hypothetical protein
VNCEFMKHKKLTVIKLGMFLNILSERKNISFTGLDKTFVSRRLRLT